MPATLQAKASRVRRKVSDAERAGGTASMEAPSSVQAKTEIGGARDSYETEADAVSDRVSQNASIPQISSIPSGGLNNTTQKKRNPQSGQATQNKSAVAANALRTKGGGNPLNSETRNMLESRMGADLSGVRIHKDSNAQQAAKGIGARAFAVGNNIALGAGESETDTKLMAHEATHVIQQGAAKRNAPTTTGTVQMKSVDDDIGASSIDADLAAELAASENESVAAIDPAPAQRAQEQAIEEAKPKQDKEVGKKQEPKQKEEKKQKIQKPTGKRKKGKGKAKKKNKGSSILQYLTRISDTAAQVLKRTSKKQADTAKTHDDAKAKKDQMEKSVVAPEMEGQALGNAKQVENVNAKPEPITKGEANKSSFQNELSRSVPSDISSMNTFKSKGKGKVVGSKVLGDVSKDVSSVTSAYGEMSTAPVPKPDGSIPEPLPEVEPLQETQNLQINDNIVPPLKPEHTDFSKFEKDSDDLLKKEELSEKNLDMVDSGELLEARQERQGLKKKVREEPAKIQEAATQQSKQAQQQIKTEEDASKTSIQQQRQKGLGEAKTKQQKAKTDLEKQREAVTKQINKIYETAKSTVTQKLETLEAVSLARFDRGQASASQAFENEVNTDISRWKRKRYSGRFGGLKWAKDKLFGIDDFPEVKAAFDRARTRYIQKIDTLITSIKTDNDLVIKTCKETLSTARTKIKEFVDGLGPKLKAVGDEALNTISTKLDTMDKFIDEKKKKLDKALDKKREEAIKAIDKKIEKMKEAMSGALAKLGNLLLDAAIKFFKWGLKKVGANSKKLMGIINKGRSVIKKIVTDPIGFLGNVIRAVKNGIFGFQKNIKKHLLSGLVSWLTGAMGEAGITLPQKFDMKGIFSIALQILGLTWQNIRIKLVKRLGERVVAGMEKSVSLVKNIITKGPIALWDMIKAKAAEIKTAIIGGIRNWIIVQVVKQAVFKLVSMLNPAGAILQAILMIYNVIMFFVENIQRIVEFVGSVFNSIGNIAMGKIGAASKKIEQTLALTIPIIINFFLRFIGLGNIGKSIRGIIMKARRPVDKIVNGAIDWLVKKAKSIVKKAGKSLKKGANAVLGWLGLRKKLKVGKESHTLYMKKKGAKSADLMMRSTPQPIEKWINDELAKNPNTDRKAKLKAILKSALAIKKLKDTKSMGKGVGEKITDHFTDIAKKLAELGDGSDLPPTKIATTPQTVAYDGTKPEDKFTSTDGHLMTASPLSINPGGNSGSEPGETSPLHAHVNQRQGAYIRGHLLNHNLFGIGKAKNMAPIPSDINKQMSKKYEEPLKKQILQKKIVAKYTVNMVYGSRPKRKYLTHEHQIPTAIELKADKMKLKPNTKPADPNSWEVGDKIFANTMTIDLSAVPDTDPFAGQVELKRLNLKGNKWHIPNMTPAESKVIIKKELLRTAGIGPTRVDVLLSRNWTSFEEIKKETITSGQGERRLFSDKDIATLRSSTKPVVRMSGETVHGPK